MSEIRSGGDRIEKGGTPRMVFVIRGSWRKLNFIPIWFGFGFLWLALPLFLYFLCLHRMGDLLEKAGGPG